MEGGGGAPHQSSRSDPTTVSVLNFYFIFNSQFRFALLYFTTSDTTTNANRYGTVVRFDGAVA